MDDDSLLAAILDGPLTELLRDQLTEEELAALEPHDDKLRAAILAACGAPTAAALGHRLNADPSAVAADKESAARELVAQAMVLMPPPTTTAPPPRGGRRRPAPPPVRLDQARCRVVADAYLDRLMAIDAIR